MLSLIRPFSFSKFPDDTKIAIRVNTLNDIRSMQRTLAKLVAWANRWGIGVLGYGVQL